MTFGSNELEGLEFRIPNNIGHPYSQWFRSGNLDRWKATLKIFRYYNIAQTRCMKNPDGKDDEEAMTYLKGALEYCDFVWIECREGFQFQIKYTYELNPIR